MTAVKLWAISDLHLSAAANCAALRQLPCFPEDWLILAGDVCENAALFDEALAHLTALFARVIWVPGSHELWLVDQASRGADSLGECQLLVALARRRGVTTPEDPFPVWPPTGLFIVPLATLYDYSFRPKDIRFEDVLAWAAAKDCVCADEYLIDPAPWDGIAAWCALRCAEAERRLDTELSPSARTILVSHFPLREELMRVPRIPRFTPWCGTRLTEDWHRRYRAAAVVTGHLQVRRTDWRDGTCFAEVSLGYPRQWDAAQGTAAYLRDIGGEASALAAKEEGSHELH